MIVAARPAVPADVEVVAALARQAAHLAISERGGALFLDREFPLESRLAELAAVLDDESRLLAVGTVDDVVLGAAVVRMEVVGGGQLARLEALWVDPAARGVGVGSEIVGLIGQWADERAAIGIDAHALPGDRATKNLFESAGFAARLIVMHRRSPEVH